MLMDTKFLSVICDINNKIWRGRYKGVEFLYVIEVKMLSV